jgi:hypothetical protein
MTQPQHTSPSPAGQPRPVSALAQSTADRVRSLLHTADRPLIMGILNVTPDSFSDGGRYDDPARAVAHGCQLRLLNRCSVPRDTAANAAAHAAAIRDADARLVVFPELSLTGCELDMPPIDLNHDVLLPGGMFNDGSDCACRRTYPMPPPYRNDRRNGARLRNRLPQNVSQQPGVRYLPAWRRPRRDNNRLVASRPGDLQRHQDPRTHRSNHRHED